jgi:peptidyl-prolyl cis-trans isomerase SurA
MKLTWLFSIILLGSTCFAQDPVILTINSNNVHKSEFEQIYWKNKKEKLATKEDLDEYIELFINFKLKVIAAENKGLDTLKKFINELQGYKIQLEKPYLTDTSINENLLKEAYYRTVNEINASHLMIKLPPNPSNDDTLKAWNKIIKIRKSIIKENKNFEEQAEKFSEDPSAKFNKGNLGYFSAFKMLYPFEEAAYSTPIGKISKVVRTRYGYHILKPNSFRKAKGKVKTAHIMFTVDPKSRGENEKAMQKINNLYEKLKNGDSFNELAQENSDDRNSAKKGGEIGWIGSGGNFYKEFEDAVFSLKNDNEFSKPFKTPNGWHIVKRLAFEPIGDYKKLKYELKNKIQKDARSQKTVSSFIEKLKDEYSLESKVNEGEIYKLLNNKSFNFMDISYNKKLRNINNKILEFADKSYTNLDFIDHLIRVQSIDECKESKSKITKQFNSFVNKELIEFEKKQLPIKYPDFKALLKEYRDGILLFEISDQMIWSKAMKDTTGLKKFYSENSKKWMWDNRIKAEFFYSDSKKQMKKMYSLKKKRKLSNDSIISYVNSLSAEKSTFKSETEKLDNIKNLDVSSITVGLQKPILEDQKWKMINIIEILPSRPKTLNEAEGIIVSEYQSFLEKSWLIELKKNNNVQVNLETLYSIKEKP